MADGTQFPPRPDFYRAARGDAARNRDSRHAVEPHSGGLSSRLNWLRAAVLGANDGIVSVSSQRDSEKSLLARDRRELREMPPELNELAAIYEAKGVSPQTAAQVVAELTAHDALAAHVDAESRLDPEV